MLMPLREKATPKEPQRIRKSLSKFDFAGKYKLPKMLNKLIKRVNELGQYDSQSLSPSSFLLIHFRIYYPLV
jgi:hypothetical protein